MWLKDAERVPTSSCEAPEARKLWTESKQDVLFVQETKLEIPETPPAAGEEQTNQHNVCSLCDSQSSPGFNQPAGENMT